ncbi:MAG: hypothetical protein ABIG11_00720 [bacterium]
MSDIDELKDILNDLRDDLKKDGVPVSHEKSGPLADSSGLYPPAASEPARRGPAGTSSPYDSRMPARSGNHGDAAAPTERPPHPSQRKTGGRWDEQKEIILLASLVSLITVIIGALISMHFLLFLGGAGLAASLGLIAWTVLSSPVSSGATADALDRKLQDFSWRVSQLEQKTASLGQGTGRKEFSSERADELEEKIEELRVIIKSLAGRN